MQKIATNNVPRRVKTAAIRDFDAGRIGISMRIRRERVGGIDSDIMPRKLLNQLTFCRDGPFFEMRREPIRISKNKIGQACLTSFFCARCGTNEAGNDRGESRRRVSCIFLPSLLSGNRPLKNEVSGGAQNRQGRIEKPKGSTRPG